MTSLHRKRGDSAGATTPVRSIGAASLHRKPYAAFSDDGIQSFVGAPKQALTCGFVQDGHTVFVARIRVHKQKVLANASGKQLRILRHESDPFSQLIQIDILD